MALAETGLSESSSRERAVLWCMPGAASLAVHLVLAETGTPYDLRWLDIADPDAARPAAILARSPDGRVPVLELDGLVLTESAAICLFLADRAGKLAPAVGTSARAELYRRLIFMTNTVQETFLRFFYAHHYVDDAAAAASVTTRSGDRLDELMRRIQGDLDGPYVLGDEISIADHYLFMLVRWGRRLPEPAWSRPRLREHWLRMAERAAVQRVLAEEGLDERPPFAG